MASAEPGGPNSHFPAEEPTMHVAALAKLMEAEPERSPHSNGPDTPSAATSIIPVFKLTWTLQLVTASALDDRVPSCTVIEENQGEPFTRFHSMPPGCASRRRGSGTTSSPRRLQSEA